MKTRLIVAIVAATVLPGCGGRPGTARDERDAALGADARIEGRKVHPAHTHGQ